MLKALPIAAGAALVFTTAANALVAATPTALTEVRSGPGTQYGEVAVVPANYPITIEGCIAGTQWCLVYSGLTQGWANDADLATTSASGQPMIVAGETSALGLNTYSYNFNGQVAFTNQVGNGALPAG